MPVLRSLGTGRGALLALLAAALLVRLTVIGNYRSWGSNDLAIYMEYGGVALRGLNPYLSHDGSSVIYSDNTPLHVLVSAAVLYVFDHSALAYRVCFALADVAVLTLLARIPMRRAAGRWAMLIFYAFNPYSLVAWFQVAEDKPLVMLLVVLTLMGLAGRPLLAASGTGLMAAYKVMGLFLAPLVVIHELARTRWRAWVPAALIGGIFLIGLIPWFPESLRVLAARQDRTQLAPIHSSPLILLDRLGLYAPVLATVLIIGSTVLLYALYLARRIDAQETAIFVLLAAYLSGPDVPENRIVLGLLPMIILFDWTRATTVALWLASVISAFAAETAIGGLPPWLPGRGFFTTLFGLDSSVAHAAWMLLFPLVFLAVYVRDKRAGGTTDPQLLLPTGVFSLRSRRPVTSAATSD